MSNKRQEGDKGGGAVGGEGELLTSRQAGDVKNWLRLLGPLDQKSDPKLQATSLEPLNSRRVPLSFHKLLRIPAAGDSTEHGWACSAG